MIKKIQIPFYTAIIKEKEQCRTEPYNLRAIYEYVYV